MSSEAAPFICMRLMFRCGTGVPGTVIIEAISSVLGTPLFPLTFDKWTGSRIPHYTGAWCEVRFNLVARSETSGLDKSEDDKLLTAPSLRCCISSLIFASLRLERWKHCEAWGDSCGILARPQSQSMCKWLQVMRKDSGCPFSILPFCCFISLQPHHFCPHSSFFGRLQGY